ncbi:TRAP transporter substrate-binding protein [Horticoccus sp. 23ND18S-11]|uniref:TRAP transporter substrate-binding protein n=1 Tax=Horticoccus sp. 23ND18S-11 TaxID=3391832 RepID=UPI0039C91631
MNRCRPSRRSEFRLRGHNAVFRLGPLGAVALVVAALFVAGCGAKRDVKVIKLAHGLDPQHSVHKGMVFLGEKLAEKSGGTMRVDVYPSGQLGSERECLELVQLGGLAMTKVSASVLEGFAPEFKVFGLPYLFRNDAHKTAVLDGPIGREILAAPQSKFMRGLCYYDSGSRSFYTKSRPVRTPDDLKGLKIRVQESPMAFALIRAFGASATPISFGELYTSLQQGVVDGAENNPPSFHLARHYEVCKFYSLDEHTSVPDVVVISTHFWNSLTPQQQKWLQEAADESAVHQRALWEKSTIESLAAVEKAGVEIIRPDKTLFAARVAELHETARQDPIVGPLDRRIAEVKP